MERVTILLPKKTKQVIDKKRGNMPTSVFLRKDLEARYK